MLGAQHRDVIFPNGYVWFVFVSALDIILTCVILHLGGREANSLAERVVFHFGLPGMAFYKMALVSLIICICEYIGRRDHETARKLISVGIMITCMPVVLALALIRIHG
jgi:hypothetical protein